MNTPKAIELALASMLRQHVYLGPKTLVRPWQSLDHEGAFDPSDDRTFPSIDIRFGPEKHDDNQVTLACSGILAARTYHSDDANHQEVSAIYESIHTVTLGIFRAFMGVTASTLFDEFTALVYNLTNNAITIGGITLDDGVVPFDDGGENAIGVGFGVHFSYT